jgi:hypothetical protein
MPRPTALREVDTRYLGSHERVVEVFSEGTEKYCSSHNEDGKSRVVWMMEFSQF